ncbi:replication-relaxation family protein [Oceanobacillus oncorhynchi]|uniref:replication-relaxation family protein n=1 Tax=Oceanobacillus oncorhynchi TaxID=545501 RepID=UPI0034D5BD93
MMIQQQKRQQREEVIMLSLDNLTYATRKQLQIINNLGGDRNAHRILHEMEKSKLISSIRTEQKVYFLSSKGKELIASNQGELKKSWITHTLMRNDLYIKLEMPDSWRKEKPVKWGENKLIPDATFKKAEEFHFVEIDNQQSMSKNIDKIKKYKDLSHVIFHQFNHHPTLIWSTISSLRAEKITEACKKEGLKFIVY